MEKRTVAIIGGGAAGMMAACAAAQALDWRCDGRVLLLEGAPRVGKKLLATGNGRCNLTNMQMDASHYHGDTQDLPAFLAYYSPAHVLHFFRELGLLCREEQNGLVYPYAGQASAVSDVLRKNMERGGVAVRCDLPVSEVVREKGGFRLFSAEADGAVHVQRVILACGGRAAPQFGCKGVYGYNLAKQLGHQVTPLRPALAPLGTPQQEVKILKGVRCRAEVSLYTGDRCLQVEEGEVQFTETGLSGICVFALARRAGQCLEAGKKIEVRLRLMPEYTADEIESLLREKAGRMPELSVAEILEGLLHKRIAQALCNRLPQSKPLDWAQVARELERFSFSVTGVAGWQKAQVTAGGVPMGEVEWKTMQSKKCKGVYIAGEMLDIDGDCGGYNLHWAWSSGLAAGQAAGRWLKDSSF